MPTVQGFLVPTPEKLGHPESPFKLHPRRETKATQSGKTSPVYSPASFAASPCHHFRDKAKTPGSPGLIPPASSIPIAPTLTGHRKWGSLAQLSRAEARGCLSTCQ